VAEVAKDVVVSMITQLQVDFVTLKRRTKTHKDTDNFLSMVGEES
jgi:hypothetical protein